MKCSNFKSLFTVTFLADLSFEPAWDLEGKTHGFTVDYSFQQISLTRVKEFNIYLSLRQK